MARKALLIGGLLYILISMAYGSIFGVAFHDIIAQQQQTALETAIRENNNLNETMADYEKAGSILSTFKGSHSHLALFGLIALVLAPTLRYYN